MKRIIFLSIAIVFVNSIAFANDRINRCLKNKDCEVIVFGAGTASPKMSFLVLEKVWKKFEDKDKNELRELLKQKIEDAHKKPGKYAGIPASAPAYGMFLNNIRNMNSYSVILSEKKDSKGMFIDKEIMINY